MHPLLETAGVLALAAAGALAGARLARRSMPLWIAGFVIACAWTWACVAAWRFPEIASSPPLSWVMRGRTERVVLAVLIPFAAAGLVGRLRRRRERAILAVGLGAAVAYQSVLPFLLPALVRGYLSSLTTQFDRNDICIQSNGYTCGPAAAATALRMLGHAAGEGELAILARTTPIWGTEADCLLEALRERYGSEGLSFELRTFRSIDELRAAGGMTLAVVKLSLFLDHYVAVLEVADDVIVVGDPLRGLRIMPHDAFLRSWHYYGIVVARDKPAPAARSKP